MLSKTIVRLFLLLLFYCFHAVVFAQSSCNIRAVSAQSARLSAQAGNHLERWLNNTQAKVAIIARYGQHLEHYNIVYSHAAFAVKGEDNRWQVYHLLNTCPKNTSYLYQEGLGLFLISNPKSYKVAVVIPHEAIQEKLQAIISEPQGLNLMYDARYSAISFPFSTLRQNSNGWILEMFALAAAENRIKGRQQAQNWLKAQHYQPSVLRENVLKQFIASLAVPNISLQGHPQELLQKKEIWVNSGDSVLNFVAEYALPVPDCQSENWKDHICIVDTLPNLSQVTPKNNVVQNN